MLDNAWLIPLIPAISFLVILFFGKRLPKKGAEVGIAALTASFVIALLGALEWIGEEVPREPAHGHHEWFELGGVHFGAGFHVDGLTVMMLVVVTFISLLVHVYSTGYLHGDRRYTYFFAALSLFTAAMLLLVVSDNTLQLMIGWELVGLCSFMLIGHWWEEGVNSGAAIKAFITTRTGDIGLMTGIITLFFAAGRTFDIEHLNHAALTGEIGHGTLLVGASLLILGVMGKSAQFPLHVWLPDAMAGPTPVSALIHAATMVVAGVYLIARLYGVFFAGFSIEVGGTNLVAIIGAITVIIAALLAFVQDDVKKVLAYSTVSQLGYMVMALGVGAWTAAVFHLFTHAFFKALLFLGSGSVSHAVHSFDMKKDMGGLKKYMPTTFATFMVGSVALAGIFPLAGFWSKDEILLGARQNDYHVFLVVGLVGAFMTATYMTRCVYLTFFGEYRGHGHPHESPPAITVPLIVLAVFSIGAGLLNAPFTGYAFADFTLNHTIELAGVEEHAFSFPDALLSTVVVLAGIAVAGLLYFGGRLPVGLTRRNRAAHDGYELLINKYYLDHLYTGFVIGSIKGPIARASYWFNQNVIDAVVNAAGIGSRKLGEIVYRRVDQGVVDRAVNGAGLGAEDAGGFLRVIQSGRVQQYGALLFGGATVLAFALALFAV